ncbi:hypothetical protein JVT61DRAFT_2130 [Boletus reticuloceps]|uniref:Phosphatidic acid phosphatase type 2/haloperoxidase domain-containing protein n=1 Tax=Boletus reticuloceps TaxID=495285 RepID=A0A8I3A8T8_9AGAM|nr:hypothetical protein JVT61DRAFT_2130 [Boletus reticuloceps]
MAEIPRRGLQSMTPRVGYLIDRVCADIKDCHFRIIYFAVGGLACALSAKVVKRTIRQQRPRHGERTTYGYVLPGTLSYLPSSTVELSRMPSTHASACTFFAVSVLLGSLYLPQHPSFHPIVVYAPFVVVPWAGMIVLSRVWLGYHTWPQVMGGVCFGICFASLWFKMWVEDTGGIGTLGREMEVLVVTLRPFLLVAILSTVREMSLRRFAQVNAANVPSTPHSPSPHRSSGTQTPATPRTRISYLDSPSSTPSISSSTPFDWEAARSRRPPPYATPPSVKRKARMSTGNAATSPRKAFIRKKGFVER